jgi:hypothetical protein
METDNEAAAVAPLTADERAEIAVVIAEMEQALTADAVVRGPW